MTTYVLTVSEFFPAKHIKAGMPTEFLDSIANTTKKHTIRGNYELWAKRFEKINKGEAILSVRYWAGKPYNSKQIEAFRFDNSNGIGIQKVKFDDYLYGCLIDGKRFSVDTEMIAENDGLNSRDFEDWFKDYDSLNEMAIIHFTPFRYK